MVGASCPPMVLLHDMATIVPYEPYTPASGPWCPPCPPSPIAVAAATISPHPTYPPHPALLRRVSAPSLLPSQRLLHLSPKELQRLDTYARLCSQHHESEYSLLRHPPGSPDSAYLYVPMTLRRPDKMVLLRERQALAEAREWYFPAVPPAAAAATPPPPPTDSPPFALTPPLLASPFSAISTPQPWQDSMLASLLDAFTHLTTDLLTPQPPLLPLPMTLSSPRSRAHAYTYAHGRRPCQVQQCTSACCTPGVRLPGWVKTSETHPISTSMMIPRHLIPFVSHHISLKLDTPRSSTLPSAPPTALPLPLTLPQEARLLPLVQAYPVFPPSVNLSQAAKPTAPPKLLLGNLYLSSCPGKKVRLPPSLLPLHPTPSGGGVGSGGWSQWEGKGAICRDLDIDLGRIKNLGVGCVICCLDDPELSLLSAPFPHYLRSLSHLGLSLIRIPIPEGLAPSTPQLLFERLEWVIRQYTQRGVGVLVHCRGGVGRAGVVAACWALMLGLVALPAGRASGKKRTYGGSGALDGQQSSGFGTEETEKSESESEDGGEEEEAVMRTVREAIHLMRVRRGLKAVESAEQVGFLRDFVRFLVGRRDGLA